METLALTPVQPAIPHALPFRVFFEEYRLRREADLLDNVRAELKQTDATDEEAAAALLALVAAQEQAYADLSASLLPAVVADKPGTIIRKKLRKCDAADEPLKHILHRMEASALCLSGGGIRSASFGLGILEGLAGFSRTDNSGDGLLDTLDYLSTVSGGGYIGSWLSSWLVRRKADTDAAGETTPGKSIIARARSKTWGTAWQEVITALANKPPCADDSFSEPVTGGDPEPQPVRHLRSYTAFLAPALGLSLDTFALVAIIFRNLLINWTMLLPVLFACIVGVRTSGMLMFEVHNTQLPTNHSDLEANGILIASTVCFLIAALSAALALPSHHHLEKLKRLRGSLLYTFIATVLVGAWLLAVSETPDPGWEFWPLSRPFPVRTGIAFVGFATLAISIWQAHTVRMDELSTQADRMRTMQQTAAPAANKLRWRSSGTVLFLSLLAAVVSSFLASSLLLLVQRGFLPLLDKFGLPLKYCGAAKVCNPLHITVALPAIVAVLLVSTAIFCALLGVYEKEEDREWWVRCGGFFVALGFVWSLSHAAVFYSSAVWAKLVAVIGLVLAGLTSWLGASGGTAATADVAKTSQISSIGRFLVKHNLVLPTVAFISIAMVVIGNVAGEEQLRLRLLAKAGLPDDTWWTFVFFLICTALALILNFAININLFSLGGMYRMRLMRAFLGASNGKRQPDPFTNFDPKDTPLMRELNHSPGAPLHIINTTLNLVGTKDTAWSQRRAESFTFSSVHSGGWRVGYVPAANYGGPGGTTLASAMSISGAAFNPNMGYQSSPILSLLMTFFCLRLGVWLPNPARPAPGKLLSFGATGQDFFAKGGPSFALLPLVAEAFGLTDDKYRWVELTDGGHFENLALYEMVMRRCKHIIVVDAGADPKCQFEDLGNAIRKIHIDLGVPIRLKEDLKMRAGMKRGNKYCVVGEIDYGCVDTPPTGASRDSLKGTLVYIKAGLNGSEPADILQYAYTHPTFPHEGTGNQFYNESQFESYRHLGTWVIEKITDFAGKPAEGEVQDLSMNGFSNAADAFWGGPRAKVAGRRKERTSLDAAAE